MPLVKQILKQHDVQSVNVKVVNGLLIIGVKNDEIKRQYQQQIPKHLFNDRNYQLHRHHHQRHREQQQQTK